MFTNNPNNQKAIRPAKGFFFVLAAAVLVLAIGAIVMFLWNAILPNVTSAKPLNYWQAVGLLILARILFGSYRSGGRHRKFGRKKQFWREKWMDMTDEERANFKSKWQDRCSKMKRSDQEDSQD